MKQACLIVASFLLLPGLHYALAWKGLLQAASYMTASGAFMQAGAYLIVLTIFASSLLRGHTPLIARFACLTRGTLTPELVTYTRRVTIAWCLFCIFMIATPLLLLAFAPGATITVFITTLNLPLLAAMAGGEYVYRLIRYRHLSHETPAEMVRLMRRFRGLIRP